MDFGQPKGWLDLLAIVAVVGQAALRANGDYIGSDHIPCRESSEVGRKGRTLECFSRESEESKCQNVGE